MARWTMNRRRAMALLGGGLCVPVPLLAALGHDTLTYQSVRLVGPSLVYVLDDDGTYVRELYVDKERVLFNGEFGSIGVFHWKNGLLHRDGDVPAMQAYYGNDAKPMGFIYALEGRYARPNGGATVVLFDAQGAPGYLDARNDDAPRRRPS